MWSQTGVTVRKRLSWVVTSVTLTFDLWPWLFAWTSHLSLVTTSENFMMIGWWEHSQKGVTDGRTDRRTDGKYHSLSCLVAAKNNRHLFCATSNFVHHFIAISVFKLELQSGNAQFGWKLLIFFLAGVTLKYNKAPLICYLKLCGLFSSHQWIQIGVNSPEMPNLGQNRRFFLCHLTLKFARRPWKTIGHLYYATSSFVYHLIAICEFKLELGNLWPWPWTSLLSMVITPEILWW